MGVEAMDVEYVYSFEQSWGSVCSTRQSLIMETLEKGIGYR